MMNIRVNIVGMAYRELAKASTIAIRYSAVRVQGFVDTKAPNAVEIGENCVLDYKMQQYRLFKALALSYGIFWNARYIKDYLDKVQEAIQSKAPHAKAFSTTERAAESAREQAANTVVL